MTSLWYLSGLYVWVYQGCFWHCVRHDKFRLLWQAFGIYQGYAFEFIKAVPGTVLDKINAAYHDKPLIFTKAVSDTVLESKFASKLYLFCNFSISYLSSTVLLLVWVIIAYIYIYVNRVLKSACRFIHR